MATKYKSKFFQRGDQEKLGTTPARVTTGVTVTPTKSTTTPASLLKSSGVSVALGARPSYGTTQPLTTVSPAMANAQARAQQAAAVRENLANLRSVPWESAAKSTGSLLNAGNGIKATEAPAYRAAALQTRSVNELEYEDRILSTRSGEITQAMRANAQSGDYAANRQLGEEYRKLLEEKAALAEERKRAELMERQALKDAGYRDATLKDLALGSVMQGFKESEYGRETYDRMMGRENEADALAEDLAGDDYKFIPEGWLQKGISGAMKLLGQQAYQLTSPETLAVAGAAAGTAALAGQMGPQLAAPEEVITVPGAFLTGMKLGSAEANMEIEAGFAYSELLENGISEEVARPIAMCVGAGNAALELLQLDELADAFTVLKKSGGADNILKVLGETLEERAKDVGQETLQEVAQEGVTIAGAQAASQLEKGQWAYSAEEVAQRLGETAGSSALSFAMMNVPAGASNVAGRVSGQNKTASGVEAGAYRAEIPQNVELPTVPIINLSMDDVAKLNGGTMPQAGNYVRKAAYDDTVSRLSSSSESCGRSAPPPARRCRPSPYWGA